MVVFACQDFPLEGRYMLRQAIILCFSALTILSVQSRAYAADKWVQAGSVEIDPREAGSRVIEVGDAKGSFRVLRLSAAQPVKLNRIAIAPAGAAQVIKGGPVDISAPVEIWSGSPARIITSVGLTWSAHPTLKGPVKIALEGLQNDDEAKERRDDRSARTGASRSIASAPPPPPAPAPSASGKQAAPPSDGTRGIIANSPKNGSAGGGSGGEGSRGIEAARPSGAPRTAPAPALPPVVASAPPGQPAQNVCVEQKICTIVDVFFGTTRNQLPGTRHITFGYERSELKLGHAFVTVPKANREAGSIPVPTLWQRVMGVPPEGDPSLHFTIPKDGVKVYASEEAFLAEAKKHIANAGDFKDHAFIYVHGFAVTFENAMFRAAQISYDLSRDGRPFGTAFVYTWPSKGSILPTAYFYDQDSADYAATQLGDFIRLVTEKTGVKNVHIIAHSMGNRVLMRTLDEVAKFGGTGANINLVILAAPDVDKQQFETLAKSVIRVAKGMTLYASQSDTALQISRRARGDAAPPRAGDVAPPAGPAIVAGIDTIDISGVSTSVFDFGHDKYADSPELLADIGKLFLEGVRPPPKRNNRFKVAPLGTLEYWRYVKDAGR